MSGNLVANGQLTGQLEEIPRIRARIRGATLGEQLFWFGTRQEYNDLPQIDSSVCYCIEEGT